MRGKVKTPASAGRPRVRPVPPASPRRSKPAAALREKGARLQVQLLDAAELAVFATDLTGKITFWNRCAQSLYGWSAQEAVGRNVADINATPAIGKATRARLAQLRRGEKSSADVTVLRPDGTTAGVSVLQKPILDQKGSLVGIAVITSDAAAQDRIHAANRLLSEAAVLPAAGADDQTQLNALAQLAVPQLADWCALHLFRVDGTSEKYALALSEAADAQLAREWLLRRLPADEIYGMPAVLLSGESKLVADVNAVPVGAAPRGERPRESAAAAGIHSYMIVPLALRATSRGTLTFVAAESGRRFDGSALAVAENLARHIALLLDAARLDRESQRLSAELEQRVEERTAALGQVVEQLKLSEAMVQTLFRVSEKLNATLNVDSLLDTLAQEAIQMVNGESGFAGLRTADGMLVRKYFLFGEAIAFVYTWRAGEGIPGWVLQHRIPYGTSDAANDPIMRHDLPINRDVRSVICTPILDSTGEVLGFFDIRNKRDADGFTLVDQEMLMALSPIASIAIQHALAYEQRVQAEIELSYSYERLRALAARTEEVREEERITIARELHDQLGQALTAMKLDLARLTRRLVEKDATLAREGRAITTQMDGLVKTVRRIATDLRPGVLDNLGLAASIEWQAREFKKRTGIACTVSVPEQQLPLTRAQSTALFRICQETLTNIARHAQAHQVHLELRETEDAVHLRVSDDGRGIQHAELAGTQTLGLLGMRERAKLLGGTFDIRGAAGQGTTVSVSIPLKRPMDGKGVEP